MTSRCLTFTCWHANEVIDKQISRLVTKLSQECIPVGCVPSAAVAVSGGRGVCPEGGWGVCPGGGGVCPGGLSGWGGCLARGCTASLPVERMTDACENITFPQLMLQMVIKQPERSPKSGGQPKSMNNRTLNEPAIFQLDGILGGYRD